MAYVQTIAIGSISTGDFELVFPVLPVLSDQVCWVYLNFLTIVQMNVEVYMFEVMWSHDNDTLVYVEGA